MVPDRQLDPYFAEFLPARKGRDVRAHQHIGCEFLILLTGRLDIQHGEITHHIEAGDAVYFDADTIHSYKCSGEESATAIIVTLQQPVGGAGARTGQPAGISSNRVRALTSSLLRPRPDAAAAGKKTTASDPIL